MKKLLKNNADKILAATLAAAFILIIIAVKTGFTVSFAENAMDGLSTELDSIRSTDEIGDVEGYALIFGGIGYFLGSVGVFFYKVLFVNIPAAMALGTIFFASVSRAVYKSEQLTAYRILTGISFAGLAVTMILSAVIVFSGAGIFITAAAALLSLYILFLLIFGIRIVYSRRITS